MISNTPVRRSAPSSKTSTIGYDCTRRSIIYPQPSSKRICRDLQLIHRVMHSSRRQPQTQPVHSFSVSDQGCSPICRHCKQQCSAMAPGHGGTLGSILQNWQASRRAGAGRLRYSFRTCSYRRIWLYAVKCAGLVIEEPDAVAGFLHSSG